MSMTLQSRRQLGKLGMMLNSSLPRSQWINRLSSWGDWSRDKSRTLFFPHVRDPGVLERCRFPPTKPSVEETRNFMSVTYVAPICGKVRVKNEVKRKSAEGRLIDEERVWGGNDAESQNQWTLLACHFCFRQAQ